jgi:hypothetical protein
MEDDSEDEEITGILQSFDSFFEDNYYLFSILGVFGAIAIYLSTLSSDTDDSNQIIINFGIISSLLLFIIVGTIMDLKMLSEFDLRIRDIILLYPSDVPYMILFVPFNALLLSVLLITLYFPRATASIIGFFSFIFGMTIFGILLIGLLVNRPMRKFINRYVESVDTTDAYLIAGFVTSILFSMPLIAYLVYEVGIHSFDFRGTTIENIFVYSLLLGLLVQLILRGIWISYRISRRLFYRIVHRLIGVLN